MGFIWAIGQRVPRTGRRLIFYIWDLFATNMASIRSIGGGAGKEILDPFVWPVIEPTPAR